MEKDFEVKIPKKFIEEKCNQGFEREFVFLLAKRLSHPLTYIPLILDHNSK